MGGAEEKGSKRVTCNREATWRECGVPARIHNPGRSGFIVFEDDAASSTPSKIASIKMAGKGMVGFETKFGKRFKKHVVRFFWFPHSNRSDVHAGWISQKRSRRPARPLMVLFQKAAIQAKTQKRRIVVYEMSKLLSCDIDKETLSVCISLLENGVNPEALAMVMKELKKESEALKEIV